MNNIDKQYTAILDKILRRGNTKGDRTGTGTKSLFGETITHDMREGFPLLTTKKMYHKGIFTELLWLLRGDTNIQWLVQNNCNIWTGDAYKKFSDYVSTNWNQGNLPMMVTKGYIIETIKTKEESGLDFDSVEYAPLSKAGFTERIIHDDDFANEWGDLGPIYGKQWRAWNGKQSAIEIDDAGNPTKWGYIGGIDQITNALDTLVNNPDSRRIMVNAWKVDEIEDMTLPPCHWAFQFYTRELDSYERQGYYADIMGFSMQEKYEQFPNHSDEEVHDKLDELNIPRRAISLMWHQRSVDTFLGLPFNIASYAALLQIFGKLVNMVPEKLMGTLGDTHLYSNHLEQAKEQIGHELSLKESYDFAIEHNLLSEGEINGSWAFVLEKLASDRPFMAPDIYYNLITSLRLKGVPSHTRPPYDLPTLKFNDPYWANIDLSEMTKDKWSNVIDSIKLEDFELVGYKSHGTIKAPLSN